VPLEKLIVDLFAKKSLMLSKGDYPSAIEMMFATYRIDQAVVTQATGEIRMSAVETIQLSGSSEIQTFYERCETGDHPTPLRVE
jgi:hypothetical protein